MTGEITWRSHSPWVRAHNPAPGDRVQPMDAKAIAEVIDLQGSVQHRRMIKLV